MYEKQTQSLIELISWKLVWNLLLIDTQRQKCQGKPTKAAELYMRLIGGTSNSDKCAPTLFEHAIECDRYCSEHGHVVGSGGVHLCNHIFFSRPLLKGTQYSI